MKKLIMIALLLQACGLDKTIDAASKAETEHARIEAEKKATEDGTSVVSAKPDSAVETDKDESAPDVTISRPGINAQPSFSDSCSDFGIEGDFRAAIDPQQGAVLSVKMNDDCDNAKFRFSNGELQVDMCSNNMNWLVAKKTIKYKVTQMAIVRERGELRFEYHANGKDEVLEYLTVSGALENAVNVCLERLK